MAIKTLCEAGLKVCALNAGRRLDPSKDFRNHRMPWDMKFRGFGDPAKRAESYGFMDSEWVEGVWEHEIPFTTAPGTQWMWPRCFAVGGKTNFWGRSSARFGDIDFRAASLTGAGVDWPLEYREIAPYYSRVERMIGVASTVQNRPSNPDGEYLPPFNFRCLDHILQQGAQKVGVPYLPDRIAQLTRDHEGSPACHFCGACTTGCDTGSFFSTPYTVPAARRGHQQPGIADRCARQEHSRRQERSCQRRCLHRSQDRAGGRSARARSRRRSVVPRIRADHAELEVAALAGGHREFERAARTKLVRPPLWRVGQRTPAAIARTAQLPRQRRRQPAGVAATLAESRQSARRKSLSAVIPSTREAAAPNIRGTRCRPRGLARPTNAR